MNGMRNIANVRSDCEKKNEKAPDVLVPELRSKTSQSLDFLADVRRVKRAAAHSVSLELWSRFVRLQCAFGREQTLRRSARSARVKREEIDAKDPTIFLLYDDSAVLPSFGKPVV